MARPRIHHTEEARREAARASRRRSYLKKKAERADYGTNLAHLFREPRREHKHHEHKHHEHREGPVRRMYRRTVASRKRRETRKSLIDDFLQNPFLKERKRRGRTYGSRFVGPLRPENRRKERKRHGRTYGSMFIGPLREENKRKERKRRSNAGVPRPHRRKA